MSGFDYGKNVTESDTVAVSNQVILHGVKTVFPTKNPEYKMLSIASEESETGFCNIALRTSCFRETGNGTYDVLVGNVGMWRYINFKKNGEYVKEKCDVSSIEALYKKSCASSFVGKQASAAEISNTSFSEKGAKSYLNMIPAKLIGGDEQIAKVRVPVPISVSDIGFAHINVDRKYIYPSYSPTRKKIIPDRMNICLGGVDGEIQAKVVKGDSLTSVSFSAKEFAEIYQQQQSVYIAKHRDAQALEQGSQKKNEPVVMPHSVSVDQTSYDDDDDFITF